MFFYWVIDILSKASRHEPLSEQEQNVVHSFDSTVTFIGVAVLGALIAVLTDVFSGHEVFSWQSLGMALGLALCQAVGTLVITLRRTPVDAPNPVAPPAVTPPAAK